MKSILLAGGGIDSTVLLVWARKVLKRDLVALHIDYGQKALEGEKRAVDYFCEKYHVSVRRAGVELNELSFAGILKGTPIGNRQEENKLEGRNITLISMAATLACTIGAQEILVGFHKEPPEKPFPDATEETRNLMAVVLKTSYTKKLSLYAPFREFARLEVLRLGMAMDKEIANKTFTCYEDGLEECGLCVHCKAKNRMLEQL